MELVVPERQQPLAWVSGDRQTQGMGIVPPLLLLLSWELGQGRQVMNLWPVNRQGGAGFTQGCPFKGLAPIGNHRQALEQRGGHFGEGAEQPAGALHNQRGLRVVCHRRRHNPMLLRRFIQSRIDQKRVIVKPQHRNQPPSVLNTQPK